MSKTAIVIQCYNEYSRLKSDSFLSFLTTHADFTIFFVDDGSTDNTLSALNEIRMQNVDQIKVLSISVNKGKAESVRYGMLEALKENQYEYIAFLDADLSAPFSEIEKMLNYAKEGGKKALFGSRVKRMGANIDRTPLRHFIGRFFSTLIGWTIQLPFYDTQCGAKIFHTSLVNISFETPFITKWLFDVEIIMRLKSKLSSVELNDQLAEYPLSVWKEVKGSKLSWRDLYRIPIDLLKIRLSLTSESR